MYANLLTNLFQILHPALFFQTLKRGPTEGSDFFFVAVHLCNSEFTQCGEQVSSNDTSNYLAYYQVLCWFSSLRDRGTNERVCKEMELTD